MTKHGKEILREKIESAKRRMRLAKTGSLEYYAARADRRNFQEQLENWDENSSDPMSMIQGEPKTW